MEKCIRIYYLCVTYNLKGAGIIAGKKWFKKKSRFVTAGAIDLKLMYVTTHAVS
jgi:hypothetical protein